MSTTMTKERPIMFTGHNVRAIMEGRKTQTRRVMKPQPPDWIEEVGWSMFTPGRQISMRGTHPTEGYGEKFAKAAFVQGDRLWVKEKLILCPGHVEYAAGLDGLEWVRESTELYQWLDTYPHAECNPLFMPKWAARLWIEITSISVERLQAITDDDVYAEGLRRGIYSHTLKKLKPCDDGDEAETSDGRVFKTRAAFAESWDLINGSKLGCGWEANPWVWAITFKKVEMSP